MVPPTISTLTHIDVWCASTGRWVTGFRVADVRPDGRIDVFGRDGGARLPEPFDPSMVRPTEIIALPTWGALTAS